MKGRVDAVSNSRDTVSIMLMGKHEANLITCYTPVDGIKLILCHNYTHLYSPRVATQYFTVRINVALRIICNLQATRGSV